MGRTFLLVVAAALLVAGCGGKTETRATNPWAKLYRPLRLPRLAHGTRCPVSTVARGVPFGSYGVGRGLGRGPAYPIMTASLRIEWPPPGVSEFVVGGWGGQRVLWFVAPGYGGPVLVRGRRLDGPDPVRFDRGRLPGLELRIPAGVGAWPPGVTRDDGQRYRRSYARLRAPGCYAFQVDGTSFSYRIVFRGVLGAESAPLTAPS